MITFDEAYERITSNGWLTGPEARLLWDTAEATEGPCVEFGTYQGRSAMLLVQLLAPRGRVLACVDPWDDTFHSELKGEEIYRRFRRNLEELEVRCGVPNLSRHVTPFRQRVEDWEPRPGVRFGLVYCDGDHTTAGTVAQLQKALECRPQAIAVHDYHNSPGGRLIVAGCDQILGGPDTLVETLAVWRKEGRGWE